MPICCSVITSTRDPCDRALDWLRAQESGDVEVIIIANAGRCGLGQAYNEGLAQARGEFCCFLHDDVRIDSANWLARLAEAIDRDGCDLVGVAGTTHFPNNGAWWEGPPGTGRGTVLHRTASGERLRSDYGSPDDAQRQLSLVVSLDGLLLFGRRVHFLEQPFDVARFDGFHFYDSDLCLRWLLWGGRRLAVVHGLEVVHDQGATLENWQRYLRHFHQRHGGFLPLELHHVETWRANLAALRATDVGIAELLASARRPGRFLRCSELPDNGVLARSGAEEATLRDSPATSAMEGFGPVIFLGAGTGRTIDRFLADSSETLWIVEPEGHLVSWLLCRFDWSGAIAAGRIVWRVPALEMAELTDVSLQATVAEAQRLLCDADGAARWVATGSTPVNANFFGALKGAAGLAEQTVQRGQSWPSRAAEDWEVTVVSPQCVIFDELAECFRRLGLRTRLVRVPDRSEDWRRIRRLHVLRTLKESPSRVVLLRNRCLLETTDPRERLDGLRLLPGRVVSWWWDVPNVASIIDLAASPQPPAVAMAREMLSLLPAGSRWLPAGARLSCCEGAADTDPPLPLTFVGQSRFALLQSNLSILANALLTYVGNVGARLAAELNRARGLPAIYAVLCDRLGDLRAAIDSLPRGMAPHAYYLHYLLSMSHSSAFRMASVAALAKLPIVVFGDSGWVDAGIVPREKYGGVLAPDRLPSIYRCSRLNLNLNFMQVSSAVNPKVLDIAAAGGPVLTDPRPELTELFPDPAARPFTFDSVEELADVANDLLHKDLAEPRDRVQQHVLAQHTLLQRAAWLARAWDMLTSASRA